MLNEILILFAAYLAVIVCCLASVFYVMDRWPALPDRGKDVCMAVVLAAVILYVHSAIPVIA